MSATTAPKKAVRQLSAYCWSTGKISLGKKVPDGALEIATGPAAKLRSTIVMVARHGYKKGLLLVPGVPEAPRNSNEAVDAVLRFSKRVKGYLNEKEAV